MIHITGDIHAEKKRMETIGQQGEHPWDKNDTLIVCGDFGFVFNGSEQEQAFLDQLERLPYQICFCDGNHENFDLLETYETEEWNGGTIHRIRRNICHLMRGNVYEIDGKTFFVMGGAYSRDKYLRAEGRSWWPQEMPNGDEYSDAIRALHRHDDQVDYIITHTAPTSVVKRMGEFPRQEERQLNDFLDWLDHFVYYDKWFFGHWHRDKDVDPYHRAVWRELVTLS